MVGLQYLAAVAAAAGVASHLFVFIQGEYRIHATYVLGSYVLLVIGAHAYNILGNSATKHISLTPGQISLLQAICFASLLTSITAYRLLFHRTGCFLGPKLAVLVKVYHAFQARDSKQHLWLDSLHKRYGDYVRMGPNEITMFDSAAILPTHGADSKCTKTACYDNLWPQPVATSFLRSTFDETNLGN